MGEKGRGERETWLIPADPGHHHLKLKWIIFRPVQLGKNNLHNIMIEKLSLKTFNKMGVYKQTDEEHIF